MKALALALVLALTGSACTGRQVDVGSDPAPSAAVSLRVVNSLPQAVNVYLMSGGSETFLQQVPANTTQEMAVPGVMPGSSVTLSARPVDGANRYERSATLNGLYEWRVP